VLAIFLPRMPTMSGRESTDRHASACRVRLEPDRHDELHPELDDWRRNVGTPIAFDAPAVAPSRLEGIDVLCWNVAIGLGRLGTVLDRLGSDGFGGIGTRTERPLMILLQEAYRFDESVPGDAGSTHHGGRQMSADDRLDVVDAAREHGLSLRYSPSMRNGDHASDRGNAILSTVRLDDASAFLLPYVRQRRVAVSARIAGHDGLTFVSAHLDTHGQARRPVQRRFGGGRAVQAAALATALDGVAAPDDTLVLGADLNSFFGMSDPAIRALVAAGMHPARRIGTWRHTFHRPVRLLLDHVLYRAPAGAVRSAEVVRLDELPGDRSRGVFGSDHHPLLARITLNGH
jgi:endonuclease/exonuclease/phosphatase family metal-dependent hydrolase